MSELARQFVAVGEAPPGPVYYSVWLNFAQTQLSLYLWARQEQAGRAGKLQNVTAVTDPPSRFWQLGMAQDMDQV